MNMKELMTKTPAARRLFELKCGPLLVDYYGGTYSVCYQYTGIRVSAGVCQTEIGSGPSFEAACEDYLRRIRGKTMIVRTPGFEWQEVEVPGEA